MTGQARDAVAAAKWADERIKDRADWLLDAVAGATQNRQFLRGDPEYDEVAGEAILMNAEKAMGYILTEAKAAGVAEERARIIKALEDQRDSFGTDEYATGQPMSSAQERIAITIAIAAIRGGET